MKTQRLVGGVLAAFALAMSFTAQAECTYPKAPAAIPDGKSASKDEMIAAMQAFKQYDADVQSYLTCLSDETAAMAKNGATDSVVQFKAMQTRKHNSALAEAKEHAGKFNEQVRAFKSKNG